jgi:hypothetical protein
MPWQNAATPAAGAIARWYRRHLGIGADVRRIISDAAQYQGIDDTFV